ncbi:hypothetical protein BJ508DRAFT_320016 [Ascobolus immersus RN42]|uniref:CENP-V/GFA domain-containing protein n=1 Tax=Ascobolus immersus RN42 TaxID=1160509 RepID=A0A3N4IT46_ASCIM|nr:hypothetical protein BJ508DRAFT_320016 [Ascobolus immersus RN42]
MSTTPPPPDPTPIPGGAHCKSIRYTVQPAPYPATPSTMDPTGAPTHFPAIDVCHCNTCRSITTAVFNTWLGIPISWVSFHLRNTTPSSSSSSEDETIMEVDGQSLLDQYLVANPRHPRQPEQDVVRYPESTLTYYSTSEGVLRSHCGKCGTGIFFVATGDVEGSRREMEWKVRDMVHLLWGTMDRAHFEEERVQPKVHSWFGDAVGFVKRGVKDGEGWGELRAEW